VWRVSVEDVIKMLEAERDKLDAAIRVLKGGEAISDPHKAEVAPRAGKKQKMSPSARAKIAQAARERWAKKKAAAKKANK
jgi:hypothetical protein